MIPVQVRPQWRRERWPRRPPSYVVFWRRHSSGGGREPGALTAHSVAPRRPILNMRIPKSKLNLPRSNAAKRSFLAPMGVPWRNRNFRPRSTPLLVIRFSIPGRRWNPQIVINLVLKGHLDTSTGAASVAARVMASEAVPLCSLSRGIVVAAVANREL